MVAFASTVTHSSKFDASKLHVETRLERCEMAWRLRSHSSALVGLCGMAWVLRMSLAYASPVFTQAITYFIICAC